MMQSGLVFNEGLIFSLCITLLTIYKFKISPFNSCCFIEITQRSQSATTDKIEKWAATDLDLDFRLRL